MGKLTRIVIDPSYDRVNCEGLYIFNMVKQALDYYSVEYSAERRREGYVIECDIPYKIYESLHLYDDKTHVKIYPGDRIIPILEAIRKDFMGY